MRGYASDSFLDQDFLLDDMLVGLVILRVLEARAVSEIAEVLDRCKPSYRRTAYLVTPDQQVTCVAYDFSTILIGAD